MAKERTARPISGVSGITGVSYEGGYVTFKFATGNTRRVPIAEVIREDDIPELSSVTVLAKLIMALFRTMMSTGLLDDGILDDEYGDPEEFIGELSNLGAEW